MGDAFSWAWNKFSKNAGTLIIPTLTYAVVIGVVTSVMVMFAFSLGETNTVTTSGEGYSETSTSVRLSGASLAVLAISYVVIFALTTFTTAAFFNGCLTIADGKPVSIGLFFKPRNFGPAIAAALLVGVFTAVGSFLCIIPGLIFAFLAQFTIPFVVDRSRPVTEALKASIATARHNAGRAWLSLLVQYAVTLAGGLLCGVGVLIAGPIAALIQTYTYRRLSGGWVAPLSP